MNITACGFPQAWWAQVDSNHRPRAYQARALTTWAMSPFDSSVYLVLLSTRSSLSSPHRLTKFGCRYYRLVEMMGIEPMTPCLQGRCSPSWATPPYFYMRFLSFLEEHSKLNNNERLTRLSARTILAVFFGFCLFVNYDSSAAPLLQVTFSIERRWSSRTFRYGYLVTT